MESIAVYSFIKGQLSHTATNVSTPLHSFAPLLFPSFLRFHYLAALAPFPTLSLLFYITSDFHSHFGATSAVLFMETEPRHTLYLQRMTLVFHQVMSLDQCHLCCSLHGDKASTHIIP